jgi:hypothetical protein
MATAVSLQRSWQVRERIVIVLGQSQRSLTRERQVYGGSMAHALSAFCFVAALAQAEVPIREVLYTAVTVGGQIAPRYDKGYLLYLHPTGWLEVFRPDGQLAFNLQLPCPGTGSCSATTVAVDARGNMAVSFGYLGAQGKAAGIRFMDPRGSEVRFVETSPYLPTMLAFDGNNDLWSLGWQRDSANNDEEQQDYFLARRFSAAGKELGRYLPRSLWPSRKSSPGAGSGGYWRMSAAADRMGAVIHWNQADNLPEWIEWSLDGRLLTRTTLPKDIRGGRAYTSDGRLYGRFAVGDGPQHELRVLNNTTGAWTSVPSNLPRSAEADSTYLFGADGNELVYRVGYGNVRLIWARPGGQ